MTSLDSLFAEYFDHRFNEKTFFIDDKAFMCYRLEENALHLTHFHVAKEYRTKGIFKQLVEKAREIAYDNGYKWAVTSVNIGTPDADRHIKQNLLYQFKPYYLSNKTIWFRKEISRGKEVKN